MRAILRTFPSTAPVLLALLAAVTGPAHAAEVRIGDFPFSCKTPDGKTVQPRHGDINGTLFIDMPAQREQCLETIKRKIYGCSINTDLGLKSQDERYPGCLPIFEEQAKACMEFFRGERAKCDVGGAEAATPDPAADEAPAADAALGSECPEKYREKWTCEGPVADGKRHGKWTFRHSNGTVGEGPIVDDEPQGHWVKRFASGTVAEGPFVDGERHGHWVVRFADGQVEEGPVVDGERHGHWVLRVADGQVQEGPYAHGKKHGHWVERWPDGDCNTFEMSAGEQIEDSWKEC